MRRIRGKHSAPELLVRKAAFSMGYRYRLHRAGLPGSPDLVFPNKRKAVFVHGCFWHWHAPSRCRIAHTPKSNRRYWIKKFLRNRKRDIRTRKALRRLGWEVLVLWECQTRNPAKLRTILGRFLGG
jgi:DNA mismatch endonuclease (patch repair protein)